MDTLPAEDLRGRGTTAGHLAAQALRVEARLTPKPGLVDALGSGSHRDMNLALLLTSADALEPWFVALAHLGAQRADVVDIQACGLAAERAMLTATGGVNTHKGALFSLGWLSAAAGRCLADGSELTVHSLTAQVSEWTEPVLREWLAQQGLPHANDPVAPLSPGQRALAAHGLAGVRGQAAAGFPMVRDHGLPGYRTALARGWSEDDALLWVLVELMAHNDDTNLAARGGMEALRRVQAWAGDLASSCPSADVVRAELAAADLWFREAWVSPGGSADLLALTWWLAEVTDVRER